MKTRDLKRKIRNEPLTPEQEAQIERIREQSARWGIYTIAELMEKLNEQFDQIEQLRAALWPFAMKEIKGMSVCADDFRRAGEAMPHAPDHVHQQSETEE